MADLMGAAMGAMKNKRPGVFDTAVNSGCKILSAGATAVNASNAVQKIKHDMANTEQHYQKLAEENDDTKAKQDKKDKKDKLIDSIPVLAGAALLAMGTRRAIQAKDPLQPFKDIKDGVARVPAAVVNRFSRKSHIASAVREGVADGINATAKAAKVKPNNSFMGNVGTGVARGIGELGVFYAGSKYLEHKAKKARENKDKNAKSQAKLNNLYTALHPTSADLKSGIDESIREMKDMRKQASFKSKQDFKDMTVDAMRGAVPRALATAGATAVAASLINKTLLHPSHSATSHMVSRTNDRIDEAVNKIKDKRKKGREKTASVTPPDQRSMGENIYRAAINAGAIAAASVPAMLATDRLACIGKNRAMKKRHEEDTIRRRYAAMQKRKMRESGGEQNA